MAAEYNMVIVIKFVKKDVFKKTYELSTYRINIRCLDQYRGENFRYRLSIAIVDRLFGSPNSPSRLDCYIVNPSAGLQKSIFNCNFI